VATSPLKSGHQIELLEGGHQFFPALLNSIESACHEIRLETYIFHFDASGCAVAAALIQAARRGVQVYVVVDGVGSPDLPAHWAEQFKQSGVQWHAFSPLGWLGYLLPMRWRRLHRKLCIVDQQILFCGGINILDDHTDPNHGTLATPRFDFAVRVQGPLVQEAHRLQVQFWTRLQRTAGLPNRHHQTAKPRDQMSQRSPLSSTATPPAMLAGLVLRDNFLHRTRIERAYRKAIAEAKHEILIANAYFLPGRKIRKALLHAVQRGVKVQLLVHGKYEYFMQYHAARPIHHALLSAGIEIYEYSSGFLHAKVAVIDQNWATVGSSNLDPLSLLLAREANVVVQNRTFAHTLRQSLLAAMQDHGKKMQPDAHAHRPLLQRILDRIAYSLMRLSLFLTGKRY
jgi:cardiolipin synthase